MEKYNENLYKKCDAALSISLLKNKSTYKCLIRTKQELSDTQIYVLTSLGVKSTNDDMGIKTANCTIEQLKKLADLDYVYSISGKKTLYF
jgi:hypothetical protein